MFEENVIKLRKDQFVEAESVAYLIKDELKRKLAFANTCCLFAFKNYIERNKYKYEPVTSTNLFRVPIIAEKYGISDLYLDNIRIDVRVSLDGKVFPIPKAHIKYSLAADYYVVYKGTKNPLKCEGIGYIKKENLIFDSQDDTYYYISTAILDPLSELKDEINIFHKDKKTFYETEHKLSQENFGAFLDDELDEVKSLDLIEHVLECSECRMLFVEYSFLEDVLTAINYYPDLKEFTENMLTKKQQEEEKPIEEEPQEELKEEPQEQYEENAESYQEDIVFTENIEPFETADILSESIPGEELQPEILPAEELITGELVAEEISPVETPAEELFTEEVSYNENEILPSEETPDLSIENDESELQDIINDTEENIMSAVFEETNISDEDDGTSGGLLYEDTEETIPDESDTIDTTVEVKAYEPTFNNEPEAEDDVYLITEAEDSTENISIDSDDADLSNFILNDINDVSVNTDTINIDDSPETNVVFEDNLIDTTENESKPDTPTYEDNLDSETPAADNQPYENNEENFMELDIGEGDDTEHKEFTFEDIFGDDDDNITINSTAAEEIRNDSELQNILNEPDNSEDEAENPTSAWNELFKDSPAAASPAESDTNKLSFVEYEANNNDNINDNLNAAEEPAINEINSDDITTLYDKQVNEIGVENTEEDQQISEQTLEQTFSKSVKQEKKPNNAIAITVLIILALGLFGCLGFFAVTKFMVKDNNNDPYSGRPNSSYGDNTDSQNMNMDEAMANAFSDGNKQMPVKISKMSWDKNKSATMTKDLETYLNTSASTVWDNLDIALASAQGYGVAQPTKVSIYINKKGEVKNVKIIQSCGSGEIDSIVLQNVKDVLSTMPPDKYSIKGENINLTLVVNF